MEILIFQSKLTGNLQSTPLRLPTSLKWFPMIFYFYWIEYGVIFPPGSKELVPNLAREYLGVNCQTAALEKGTKFLTLKSRKFGYFASVVAWNILSLSTQDHNIHSWWPFNFQLLWCEIIYSLDVSSTKSSVGIVFLTYICESLDTWHGISIFSISALRWRLKLGAMIYAFCFLYSTENIPVKILPQALLPISISTETNQNWRVLTSATYKPHTE